MPSWNYHLESMDWAIICLTHRGQKSYEERGDSLNCLTAVTFKIIGSLNCCQWNRRQTMSISLRPEFPSRSKRPFLQYSSKRPDMERGVRRSWNLLKIANGTLKKPCLYSRSPVRRIEDQTIICIRKTFSGIFRSSLLHRKWQRSRSCRIRDRSWVGRRLVHRSANTYWKGQEVRSSRTGVLHLWTLHRFGKAWR